MVVVLRSPHRLKLGRSGPDFLPLSAPVCLLRPPFVEIPDVRLSFSHSSSASLPAFSFLYATAAQFWGLLGGVSAAVAARSRLPWFLCQRMFKHFCKKTELKNSSVFVQDVMWAKRGWKLTVFVFYCVVCIYVCVHFIVLAFVHLCGGVWVCVFHCVGIS